MAKIKSIEELKKVRDEALRGLTVRTQTGTRIIIGMGTCGIAAGARETMLEILRVLEERGMDASVETVGCIGMCAKEPLVDIEQAGQPRVSYGNITRDRALRLIDEHLTHGRIVGEWVVGKLAEKSLQ